MGATNNINNSIEDRIQKSNKAWEMIKGELLGKNSVNIKLRLMLSESLISSILLYSLHIIPICPSSTNKLQQFHSKCTRIITKWYYQSDNPQIRNGVIRQKYNITTIESRLKYFRLKTYYRWERYISINYPNDKDYIDNELHTLDSCIASLQTDHSNTHRDNNYNTKFKYLHIIRGNNSKQLMGRIKTILSYDNETKYPQITLNTSINIYNTHLQRNLMILQKRPIAWW